MIRSAELTDFLVVDGESVVLLGGKVFRLGPVATFILELLAKGPLTIDALATELAAAFGAPPDGDLADAVAQQVADLRGAGLLAGDPADAGTPTQ